MGKKAANKITYSGVVASFIGHDGRWLWDNRTDKRNDIAFAALMSAHKQVVSYYNLTGILQEELTLKYNRVLSVIDGFWNREIAAGGEHFLTDGNKIWFMAERKEFLLCEMCDDKICIHKFNANMITYQGQQAKKIAMMLIKNLSKRIHESTFYAIDKSNYNCEKTIYKIA